MTHHRQTSKQELIAELEAAGAVVKGSAIKCPFHDDTNPSGGVFQGKDSIWRFKCHSCGAAGDVFDIQSRRTGQPLPDILKENAQDRPQAAKRPAPDPQNTFNSLDAIFDYLRAKYNGQLEAVHQYSGFSIIRWRKPDGKKEMRPVVNTSAGYVLEFPERRTLYNLHSLAGADTVIVTEGELKADILAGYGFTVTTSSGGSKAANRTDWKPLQGKKIILWPDADIPGNQYADDVRSILEPLNASVRILDPADFDLRDGEDAADYIAQLENAGYAEMEIKKNLADVFDGAKSTGPASELSAHYEQIIDGRYQTIETGFSTLDRLIQLLPGTLNLLAGSPGASKSLQVFQLASNWIQQGLKVAIFALERNRSFHLNRILAQQAGIADLTQTRFVQANPDTARQALNEHKAFLDMFGRSLWTAPDKVITQKDVIAWSQQRAESGYQILIIDPATIAERNAEPHKADASFVQGLRSIADAFRVVFLLVLHPNKQQIIMPDLSLIAGGASYSRFCDCALWLEHHDAKQSTIATPCGRSEIEHDRTLWILKSRDGAGTNARIAFDFNTESLTLTERGLILRKQK